MFRKGKRINPKSLRMRHNMDNNTFTCPSWLHPTRLIGLYPCRPSHWQTRVQRTTQGDIGYQDKQTFFCDLMAKWVRRALKPREKSSSLMCSFSRKIVDAGSSTLQKVMNFRMLNSYSSMWRSEFLVVVAKLKRIPSCWNMFTTIALSSG